MEELMRGCYIWALIAILFIPLTGYAHLKQTATTINDFSRLNKTEIHSFATPCSYKELQSIVQYAHKNNLKIAISGIRHSQGGHAFFPHAIIISLEKLNRVIKFDPNKKLITVQAGITWSAIQEFLHKHSCAVKIMQFANLFTIGGSLSVNCNGIDPHCGPLIESIESIKILMANGSLMTASRLENPELFYLAIGGYGLFGIIVEATIQVVSDDLYHQYTSTTSLPDYVAKIKKIAQNPKIGFHYSLLTFRNKDKQLFGNVYLSILKN